MDYLACTLLIGVGATAVMDLWAIARKRLLGIPPPNYGLVGRWFAHMPRGRFRHDSIAAALTRARRAPDRVDRPLPDRYRVRGHPARYLGPRWIHHPTIGPALSSGSAPWRRPSW